MWELFCEVCDGKVEQFFDGRLRNEMFESYLETLPPEEQEQQRKRCIDITQRIMKKRNYRHAFYLHKEIIHRFYNPKYTTERGISDEEYERILNVIKGW